MVASAAIARPRQFYGTDPRRLYHGGDVGIDRLKYRYDYLPVLKLVNKEIGLGRQEMVVWRGKFVMEKSRLDSPKWVEIRFEKIPLFSLDLKSVGGCLDVADKIALV